MSRIRAGARLAGGGVRQRRSHPCPLTEILICYGHGHESSDGAGGGFGRPVRRGGDGRVDPPWLPHPLRRDVSDVAARRDGDPRLTDSSRDCRLLRVTGDLCRRFAM